MKNSPGTDQITSAPAARYADEQSNSHSFSALKLHPRLLKCMERHNFLEVLTLDPGARKKGTWT